MRILISAGEPSGFLFARLLAGALVLADSAVLVEEARPESGTEPAVGLVESLAAVPRERRRLAELLARIGRRAPDRVVLVGYSGFNLPFGIACRRLGIPVVYFAPPQLWAWGAERLRSLARAADRLVCLFPFEQEFFRSRGLDAVFVGNPLVDIVPDAAPADGAGPRVVFLPGSRPAELRFHLPLFRRVSAGLRRAVPGLRSSFVTARADDPPSGMHERHAAIGAADCAVVVSGTVTLETALLGTPQIVTYHLSTVSRFAARLLVRSRYFSLPNILLDEPAVNEQLEPCASVLTRAALGLLADRDSRLRAREQAARLRRMLGPPGALERVAPIVLGIRRFGAGA